MGPGPQNWQSTNGPSPVTGAFLPSVHLPRPAYRSLPRATRRHRILPPVVSPTLLARLERTAGAELLLRQKRPVLGIVSGKSSRRWASSPAESEPAARPFSSRKRTGGEAHLQATAKKRPAVSLFSRND